MKTKILIVALFVARLHCFGLDNDLLRTRELYYKASTDKSDADLFSDFLLSKPDIEKTLLSGYQGLCYMIRANYVWNPYNKLGFFNKGKEMLNEAISKDPANLELRFLRYCVQTNAPSFLGYNNKIVEDKKVILSLYVLSTDRDLKSRIKNYLATSKHCTVAEVELLK